MSSRCRILTIYILTIVLAVFLSACQPALPVIHENPWESSDLRVLEAPNLSDPTYDLIGAYARLTEADLELRFDFLGSPGPSGYHLYVVIDTGPGGKHARLPFDAQAGLEWDIALGFPARGLPSSFDHTGTPTQIRPRIHKDEVQDAAIVRISRRDLPGDPKQYAVFAYTVMPGENQPADTIGPLLVNDTAPELQAPLYIAFWDSFPASTPAQALRRWNGAHTGPYGQRHGLSILLQAAAQNGVPLALLDLKRPEQLAALEVVGGIPLPRQMQKDNLLLLPDYSYGDPRAASTSLLFSQEAGQRFNLSKSAFRYGVGAPSMPAGLPDTSTYRAAFARLAEPNHLLYWNRTRLIPLPAATDLNNPQVAQEGLAVSIRAALLHAALSPNPADLVVLGGDLPNSPWGDSIIASPAFRYIAGHPWIRALDGDDLLDFPTIEGAPDCPDLLCLPDQEANDPIQSQIIQELERAPEGLFRDLSWQAFLHLTDATSDERLRSLRSAYLGQIGPLLAAARWSAKPIDQSTCDVDWNWDGVPECILSSKTLFLALDPSGGRLVLAAARINDEIFELVGPRSQWVVGLGDPLEWHPERGLLGDPQEIPGAFADSLDLNNPKDGWERYQVENAPGTLTLTNSRTTVRKTFRLSKQTILIEIESQQPYQTDLPLAFIDNGLYKPGAFNRYQSTDDAGDAANHVLIWTLAPERSLYCRVSGAQVIVDSFTDSRAFMTQPENPNTGFPPGHFLPFPMALLHLQSPGNLSITLQIEKP